MSTPQSTYFDRERQYSSIQTCQRRKFGFDWQRHRTARSRRRESWGREPSHHSEEAGGKRAAGTAGQEVKITLRTEGGHATEWGNRLLSPTPPSLRDGAVPGEGWWGGTHGAAPTAAPQHLRLFPTDGGPAQAQRSGKGSALRPPRSRVPAGPPEVFPNPSSHGRHVGTRSSQAAGTEAAFPRSPASALPTPPVPAPRHGCSSDLGPRAQAVLSLQSPALPAAASPVPACSRCWFRGAQSRAFYFFFFLLISHTISSVSRSNPS